MNLLRYQSDDDDDDDGNDDEDNDDDDNDLSINLFMKYFRGGWT